MFVPVPTFKGLNNVTDPLKLDWSNLTRADNVEITDEGTLQRAHGYSATGYVASAIAGAYATEDFQRMYVIDGGELRALNPGMGSYAVLATGLASAPAYFAEANGQVFFSNGTDYGWIVGNEYRSWALPRQQRQLGGRALPGDVHLHRRGRARERQRRRGGARARRWQRRQHQRAAGGRLHHQHLRHAQGRDGVLPAGAGGQRDLQRLAQQPWRRAALPR